MSDKRILEDLLSLGGDVLSGLIASRRDLKTKARGKVDSALRKLDLVGRDEFDAAFAMLAKARDMQEELAARLARVEAHLNLSSAKTTVKTKKPNLPSVKKSKLRAKKK